MTLFERNSQLVSPLDPRSVHLEECDTHDENQNRGDCREDTFPDLFRLGPEISEFQVELRCSAGRLILGMKCRLTTAMNAAPMAVAINRPTPVPAHT